MTVEEPAPIPEVKRGPRSAPAHVAGRPWDVAGTNVDGSQKAGAQGIEMLARQTLPRDDEPVFASHPPIVSGHRSVWRPRCAQSAVA